MVVFSCNGCGDSIKKAQMETHFDRCKECHSVACVDCGKEFWGNDYKVHIKCVSEEEKYSGKNYKPKPGANKGERKQDEWLQRVQNVVKNTKVDPELEVLLKKLMVVSSLPRKQKKFENFVRNSMLDCPAYLITAAWEVFSGAQNALKADSGKADANSLTKAVHEKEEQVQEAEENTEKNNNSKKKKLARREKIKLAKEKRLAQKNNDLNQEPSQKEIRCEPEPLKQAETNSLEKAGHEKEGQVQEAEENTEKYSNRKMRKKLARQKKKLAKEKNLVQKNNELNQELSQKEMQYESESLKQAETNSPEKAGHEKEGQVEEINMGARKRKPRNRRKKPAEKNNDSNQEPSKKNNDLNQEPSKKKRKCEPLKQADTNCPEKASHEKEGQVEEMNMEVRKKKPKNKRKKLTEKNNDLNEEPSEKKKKCEPLKQADTNSPMKAGHEKEGQVEGTNVEAKKKRKHRNKKKKSVHESPK